jgi:hypothetical protein
VPLSILNASANEQNDRRSLADLRVDETTAIIADVWGDRFQQSLPILDWGKPI